MKTTILKGIAFCLVFTGSLFLFNHASIKGKTEMTSEMNQAALPVLFAQVGEEYINEMHGYTDDTDASLVRDSVIPLENTNTVSIYIRKYTSTVNQLKYELSKGDSGTVLEKGTISELEKASKGKIARITIKKEMEADTTYVLKLTIKPAGGVSANYYTKVYNSGDMHVKEHLEFARYFQETTFSKDKAEELNKYLETKADGVNNNLNSVNIYSNLESITWASLKPTKETKGNFSVKAINSDTISCSVKYVVSSTNSRDIKEYYYITEYYRIRYSQDRMYLLEFERDQEELYNPALIDSSKNALKLGIVNNEEVQTLTSSDCEKVAFVQARQLWYYDYKNTQMTKVFSFRQDETLEARNDYDQHGIKIMKLSDDGEIVFAVYGYMNRGRHEGNTGLALYQFDPQESSIEELLFIPSGRPYLSMKEDADQLLYYNENGMFYVIMNGVLYRVNCNSKEYFVVAEDLTQNSCVASEENQYVAIQNKSNPAQCTQILVYNLETGKKHTIKSGKGKRLKTIGFISNRLLYGIAKSSDIKNKESDKAIFPMYELRMVDKKMKEEQAYKKAGIYVTDTEISGLSLEMQRVVKSGSGFADTTPDILIRKEKSEDAELNFSYQYSSNALNQLYMIFPNYIYVTKAPKTQSTREVLIDDYRTIGIEADEVAGNAKYLVSVNGQVEESFEKAGDAILDAASKGGNVVSSKQQTIWESGQTPLYMGIASEVPTISARAVKESKAACIAMILQYENIKAEYTELASQSGSIDHILNSYLKNRGVDLTGCTLDQAMYYIGKGAPVIAQLKENHYVLMTSYNSTAIRYTDPVTGEVVKEERKNMETLLKSKVFYSYIK